MKRATALGGIVLAFAGVAGAQEAPGRPKAVPTAAALQAEIDALKPARVAWREIAWKSCLLDGLRESRARNKPVLLWVFIDRPADDLRRLHFGRTICFRVPNRGRLSTSVRRPRSALPAPSAADDCGPMAATRRNTCDQPSP